MRKYVRRITKRNDNVFSHTISIPAKFVRKLGLSDSLVELKIKEDFIVIKKIGDTLEGISSVDDTEEDDENVTIHY